MTLPAAVLTTDASNLAVAAILTQTRAGSTRWRTRVASCDGGRAELPCARPGAAGCGPRPAGVPTLTALRRGASAGGVLDGFRPADSQPGDHVDQDEPASEQDVRLLARRCDAPARRTHPTHPLSPRGFADGDGPAPSTGDPDPESQQELFSRLDRNAPAPALLAAIRVGCANTRRTTAAAFANVQEGGTLTRPHR